MEMTDPASVGVPRWMRVRRPGERRSLSRSATRALDVLELFGHERRPLRAIEIAKALALQPSTVNQLLKTMVDSAHLTFDAVAKAYLPSPRLGRFSAWMTECFGASAWLQDLVRDVQQKTGEIVTLTTPNDLFMQVLDLAGSAAWGQDAGRGLRISIFGSAIGRAYLMTLPDAEIMRLALRARLATAQAREACVDMQRLRANGAADGPSDAGSWSVAAPLPSGSFPAPLVLGLAGPEERIRGAVAELRVLLRGAIARWAPDAPVSA